MDARKFWNRKHIDYLRQNWIDKPTIFAQFADSFFPKKGNLLDLGAGQGQDSRYFTKLGYRVVATDFSRTALSLLEKKAKKEKLDLKTMELDLEQKLPFKDNTFDIVYSHLALHYFNSQTTQGLFDEIYRVLKKDGIIAALFNTLDDPEIQGYEKIEDGYYKDAKGICKRYFTTKSLEEFINRKFNPLVLDAKGETYKDEIKTLIRFVGKKI